MMEKHDNWAAITHQSKADGKFYTTVFHNNAVAGMIPHEAYEQIEDLFDNCDYPTIMQTLDKYKVDFWK